MPYADPSELKTRVSDIVRRSAIAAHFREVLLDADQVREEKDFLRVLIEVDALSEVRDEDLQALTTSIEDALSSVDERFPSVRFAEAA
jgi:hypothetical protein